jgi:2-methylcitrate dehydratase PrpD
MLTRALAALALDYRYEEFPEEVRAMGRRCILDGVACALAGRAEPVVRIVEAEALQTGGAAEAGLIGHAARLPAGQAALVNGTAAHALDYDDVNIAIPGHPTTVVMPAVLAVAETVNASGRDVLAAFVAGYEVACRVGLVLGPGHYERGFHATATAGVVGAAAACARLLRLSAAQTASALALAATQASGLKALFGNMGKPLHAGLAARNAVLAARLARGGLDAGDDALEHAQGLAKAMSPSPDLQRALDEPSRFHILRNLFKYHAACYGTHAVLESAKALRSQHGIAPGDIRRVLLTVHPGHDKMCNIAAPRTSAEAKFSLRLNAAFGLMGVETSRLDAYSAATALDPAAVALRDRVQVRFSDALPMMKAAVEVETTSGVTQSATHDAGEPESDFKLQARKVEAKFDALVQPLLGEDRAARLRSRILAIESEAQVAPLLAATRAGG